MKFPADCHYTEDHEWIRLSDDGKTGTVGITDFAQQELGDIVYVEIDALGSDVARNEVFGTVEAVKTVSELFMPVSGHIDEVNPGLDANPEAVNDDPYGEGWMIRITLSDPSEVGELLSSEAYSATVGG
jgi:glycine cleavage system H protein